MSVEVLGPYCAKSIEFKIIKLNNNDDMIIMAFEANAHSDIYIHTHNTYDTQIKPTLNCRGNLQ